MNVFARISRWPCLRRSAARSRVLRRGVPIVPRDCHNDGQPSVPLVEIRGRPRRRLFGQEEGSGAGSPSNESTQTRRSGSLWANSAARMKIVAPPRQAPHSMRSPGTFRASMSRTQYWILSRRLMPIIVSAVSGQAVPSSCEFGACCES